jgi:hypothetical protein
MRVLGEALRLRLENDVVHLLAGKTGEHGERGDHGPIQAHGRLTDFKI